MSLRLTDEEFDLALKQEVKPTPEQGHWRVIMWMRPSVEGASCQFPPGVIARFHGEEWMWLRRHATEAEADEWGRMRQRVADLHGIGEVFVYRRAEYFPDYGSGGA